jgi:hypothetical protein
MSVELHVYLNSHRLPTREQLLRGIQDAGYSMELAPFDSSKHAGFLPVCLDGKEAGFEYDICKVIRQDLDADDALQIGNRDLLVQLRYSGGRPIDFGAAMKFAAVLAKLSDGIFYDPQCNEYARADSVFEMIRRSN